jgi:casein kinase 1
MGKSARDRTSAGGGGVLPKRSSGLAGQLDVVTPAASTQAQFQNSSANLAGNQARQSAAAGALQSHQGKPQPQQQEPQPTFFQKIMNALCCGSGKLVVNYGERVEC